MRTVVLFDLDGTLSDPYVGIVRSYEHALRRLGVEWPHDFDFRSLIGPPIRDGLEKLLGPEPDGHERSVALYREHFSTIGLFENTLYDGIVPMLERLQPHCTLYVCTSKPTVFATQILERFEIARFFRNVYGCELDGTRGDKAELLAWLLAHEDVRGREALMIGDRMHDIVAAKRNGATAAGVLWGFGSADELRDAGCARTFASPDEITVAAVCELLAPK